MNEAVAPTEDEHLALGRQILDFYADPLGFVLFVFPWGEVGTPLAPKADDPEPGPDIWQRDFLTRLGNLIRQGFPANKAIRMAVASGHGPGKTALVAWVILWFISTRPNPQIVVTANTKNQLSDKTWRELGKWQNMAINGYWFEWTATKLKMKSDPNLWFASAVPWSASNPQAFAGTHEENVLVIFDEASEIVNEIWETTEGAMTTPGAMWFAFGNPTSNTTRFRQCWTKFRKRWHTWRVDSRNAKMADNFQISQWIEDYGLDSDFVRVRVLGLFPKTGPKQLIGELVVEEAQAREIDELHIPAAIPKLMGVDVGSYGDAETVIVLRKGPIMKEEIIRFREANVTRTANMIGKYINEWKPDNVYVDASGHGHGIFLMLVQMGHENVTGVLAGDQKSVSDPKIYYNVRIEMWYRMKEWLETASIPDDQQLYDDLIGPEYNYDLRNRMRLESKDEMAKRGIPSPDTGDALALTFCQALPQLRSETLLENLEPEVV